MCNDAVIGAKSNDDFALRSCCSAELLGQEKLNQEKLNIDVSLRDTYADLVMTCPWSLRRSSIVSGVRLSDIRASLIRSKL